MKRKKIRLLPLACGLTLCLAGLLGGCKAQEEITNVPTPKPEKQTVVINHELEAPEHYIEVIGNGEIIASPDFATIQLGVTAAGETAEAASAACQEQTGKAAEAASSLEIRRQDISQRGVEIAPKQKEGTTTVTHYEATDVVTVVVRRVAQSETILTTLMDAGEFEFLGITYSITESSEAYRMALAAATQDALAKATMLAEATEVQLGQVIGIVETAYDDSALIGENFESSAIAVSAQITVRYRIA